MPIRPENRNRYPANWKQISQEAKERAGHQCEFCVVEQYAVGYRDEEGRFHHARGSAYYDQMMYAESFKKACEARESPVPKVPPGLRQGTPCSEQGTEFTL